jgi:hypothetical protein
VKVGSEQFFNFEANPLFTYAYLGLSEHNISSTDSFIHLDVVPPSVFKVWSWLGLSECLMVFGLENQVGVAYFI